MTRRGGARAPGCVFCADLRNRAVWQSDRSVAIRDAFPVTEGHTLVLPAASPWEQQDLWRGVAALELQLGRAFCAPSGSAYISDAASLLHLRPGDTTSEVPPRACLTLGSRWA